MRVISGEAKGIVPAISRAVLAGASLLYYSVWAAREAGYRLGILPIRKVGARVVSIGNIVAGGAGKPPAVIYYARRFTGEGKRVAVISRGYGRLSQTDEPVVVSDAGGKILVTPCVSGDEPYLLAKKLPGTPVIVCGDRIRAARLAIERFSPDVILLDDGFQHRAIARDEDIVVIDCSEPFGYGHLLPRGLLREPMSALKRATCFLLTRVDERKHADVVEKLKGLNPPAELILSRHHPSSLVSFSKNEPFPLDFLKRKKALALSSIGNPKSFGRTLKRLEAEVVGSLSFPDHHWYVAADAERIRKAAEKCGAELIITTEKDAVRLNLLVDKPANIFLLGIELEIIGSYPGGAA